MQIEREEFHRLIFDVEDLIARAEKSPNPQGVVVLKQLVSEARAYLPSIDAEEGEMVELPVQMYALLEDAKDKLITTRSAYLGPELTGA